MTELFFKRDIAHSYDNAYIPQRKVVYDILFITKENSYLFEELCESGDTKCVELLLKRKEYHLFYGMSGACYGGHRHIVDLLLTKHVEHVLDPAWSNALYSACLGGNAEMIDYIIQLGGMAWNAEIIAAHRNGHKELATLVIKHGALWCLAHGTIKHL